MKKVLALCLSVITAASLAACGSKTDTPATPSTTAATAAASKNLVIYCPHPLEFINPLVSEFETQTGLNALMTEVTSLRKLLIKDTADVVTVTNDESAIAEIIRNIV
jgi:ABC-type glycerol-3-phosphate transport system substrate-binding protein